MTTAKNILGFTVRYIYLNKNGFKLHGHKTQNFQKKNLHPQDTKLARTIYTLFLTKRDLTSMDYLEVAKFIHKKTTSTKLIHETKKIENIITHTLQPPKNS